MSAPTGSTTRCCSGSCNACSSPLLDQAASPSTLGGWLQRTPSPLLAPPRRSSFSWRKRRIRRASTTYFNMRKAPDRRRPVLAVFCIVSFLQGASFATFSILPGLSLELFARLRLEHLPWSLNCNNIAQALFIPGAIWMIRKKTPLAAVGASDALLPPVLPPTGLRNITLVAAVTQLLQSCNL